MPGEGSLAGWQWREPSAGREEEGGLGLVCRSSPGERHGGKMAGGGSALPKQGLRAGTLAVRRPRGGMEPCLGEGGFPLCHLSGQPEARVSCAGRGAGACRAGRSWRLSPRPPPQGHLCRNAGPREISPTNPTVPRGSVPGIVTSAPHVTGPPPELRLSCSSLPRGFSLGTHRADPGETLGEAQLQYLGTQENVSL